jgi:hypothetical protein
MPRSENRRVSSAVVRWSPRLGTTPFGQSSLVSEMAEKVRKWCVINAARLNVSQPQMAVVPVVHNLLIQNRRSYDNWGLRHPDEFRMYHSMEMNVPYLERLDLYARFYERVLSDPRYKLQLKYWIYLNRHVPV